MNALIFLLILLISFFVISGNKGSRTIRSYIFSVIGNLELLVIVLVTLLFPILFIIASKNLDPKGVFDWMLDKPKDWIGKK